jgi:feruloyl-CoA synthase
VVAAAPHLVEVLKARLGVLARAATGSATRIVRAIVIDTPPSIDRGEITDKGSINQRAVLDCRGGLVAELYRSVPSPCVIQILE